MRDIERGWNRGPKNRTRRMGVGPGKSRHGEPTRYHLGREQEPPGPAAPGPDISVVVAVEKGDLTVRPLGAGRHRPRRLRFSVALVRADIGKSGKKVGPYVLK